MVDDTFWRYVPVLVGLPVWLVALAFIARTIRDWPNVMGQFNERFRDRAKISGDDWRALREQIEWLSEEIKECRRSEGEAMTRAILAEAKLLAHGEIRNAAAIAAAEVRMDEAVRKADGEKKKP